MSVKTYLACRITADLRLSDSFSLDVASLATDGKTVQVRRDTSAAKIK